MLPFPNPRIATTGGVRTNTHVEVYNGQLRREFSRLRKLIAPGILEIYSIDKGVSVQFYAPTDCDIPDGSYVRWANLILKPDSEPVEGAD
jgi:hypothetical protein